MFAPLTRPLTNAKDKFAMATSDRTDSTIEIQLTQGYVTVVDAIDSDLAQMRWHIHIRNGRVYARRKEITDGRRQNVWLHHVIYHRMHPNADSAKNLIDHIDNDPLNNTRANLRLVTLSQNLQNQSRYKRKEQGILKGARFHKRDKKWNSCITVDGRKIHLGTFETMIEAHEAYCKAALYYFGKYARFD